MKDATKRKEIVTVLRDKSPSFGFKRSKASQVEGKWNRISALETILEWGEDDEMEAEAIRENVKNKLDELYANLEKLATVLKPLCDLTSART
jgi:hypothetical protein